MNDSNMDDITKTLHEHVRVAGGGGGHGGTRTPPSMVETGTDEPPIEIEVSIAQSVLRFTENIASYIEREADRRLSAAKADHENMHAFARRVRTTGIGGA